MSKNKFNPCINLECGASGTPYAAGSSTDEFYWPSDENGVTQTDGVGVMGTDNAPANTDTYTLNAAGYIQIERPGIYVLQGYVADDTWTAPARFGLSLGGSDFSTFTALSSFIRAYVAVGAVSTNSRYMGASGIAVVSLADAGGANARARLLYRTGSAAEEAAGGALRVTRISDFG